LSAGLIATAMLVTPVMARESHMAERHVAGETHAMRSPTAGYIEGHAGFRASHAQAVPAAPDGEDCDVGDNPFIC
jgi:hypothetical protein